MRNDAVLNGGLIGFGIGFIFASVALYWVVRAVIPQYATLWHFKGVIVIGVIGLVVGIGMEMVQRFRARRKEQDETPAEQSE
ncbi:MAG: hypothetical protein HYX83_03080 [Chloroflexi bacterium]|nr:hypothetical protein [Chloroflexota bacterium]